jgi:hypothetical protein
MLEIEHLNCCGVKELSYIRDSSAKDTVLEVAQAKFYADELDKYEDMNDFAYAIFTDTNQTDYQYGNSLRNFIKENNLGTIKETSPKRNPNTGHKVKVYIWSIKSRNLKSFYDNEN